MTHVSHLTFACALVMVSCVSYEDAEPARSETPLLADCPNHVLRLIDGEGAAMYPSHNEYPFFLTDNDVGYETALKGPRPPGDETRYQRAWLSPGSFGSGGASLAYETRGCTTACIGHSRQKVNHHFLDADPSLALSVETPVRRYIGFAMRVSRDQPAYRCDGLDLGVQRCPRDPEHEPILFQLWQGSPHSPPASAKLHTEEDGSLTLYVEFRNNLTESSSRATGPLYDAIPDFQMDTWYSIVLSIFPEHTSITHQTGNVTFGLSYRPEGAASYTTGLNYYGKWGYEWGNTGPVDCPYVSSCCYRDSAGLAACQATHGADCINNRECVAYPRPTMDFKFGIYRSPEDTALQVRFDNIKLTGEYEYALPEYECTF